MATAPQSPPVRPRWARTPFYFNSASHLHRIGRERANNLQELEVMPENVRFGLPPEIVEAIAAAPSLSPQAAAE